MSSRTLSLAFLLLGSAFTRAVHAGPLKITTGVLDRDYALTPLEFELRGLPESRSVTLKLLATGEDVPCQVVTRTSQGAKIAWLALALKKGTEVIWDVDLIPAGESRAKDTVEVKRAEQRIDVLLRGKEFTSLLSDPKDRKPYLFPIIGPTGKMITRQFPMKAKLEGEDQDHPHQRSFWFTHGAVGGVDFWSEGTKTGSIRQTRVVAADGGPVLGRIETLNEWVTPEGKKLLDDHRVLAFYPLPRDEAFIDLSVTLTASTEDVVFGDTKEGTFGIRLAESMKESRGGTIVSSTGARTMKDTWGKPADWIDYTGKVGGDLVGVAIFDHPKSFRHPTHWHVRDYGLFAANPFGYRDFYNDKSKDGSFKLEKGKSMDFRYRVYLHHGGTSDVVQKIYSGFASPPELHPKGQKA